MKIDVDKAIIELIEDDLWMLEVLKIVKDLYLNDCWVGAGFVRNKVWDHKHEKSRTALNDIDVIYFDKTKLSSSEDVFIEKKLKKIDPDTKWSVKNQARMHLRNGHQQYLNSENAISFWPETATSVAVRINLDNQIEYIAPYGLKDLFDLVVRPTPKFDLSIYADRLKRKDWKKKWSKLEIKQSK